MSNYESQCRGCDLPREFNRDQGQWWNLSNYHGISGYFCPDCYDKVSHDSYDQPRQPQEHLLMVMRLR
jgi:uncharacterized protein YlaI